MNLTVKTDFSPVSAKFSRVNGRPLYRRARATHTLYIQNFTLTRNIRSIGIASSKFILRINSLISILQKIFPIFSKDRLQLRGSGHLIPANYIFNLLPLPTEPRYYPADRIENLKINFFQKLQKIIILAYCSKFFKITR